MAQSVSGERCSRMIEEFAGLIPAELMQVSGSVFYSGRQAFSTHCPVYILGKNPGGDPDARPDETVAAHTDFVLHRAPPVWSAYCDEMWLGRPAGEAPLQVALRKLFSALQVDPRNTPASNLVFERSRQSAQLGVAREEALAEMCWPFHAAIISRLQPQTIICFGVDTGQWVRRRLRLTHEVSSFSEQNKRSWTSRVWNGPNAPMVFGLTHPARAHWKTPTADPTPWVSRTLGSTGF